MPAEELCSFKLLIRQIFTGLKAMPIAWSRPDAQGRRRFEVADELMLANLILGKFSFPVKRQQETGKTC
jgi:hypothetical protein